MLKKIAILTAAAGMLSTSMAVLAEGPTVYGRMAFGFKSISGETDDVDSQRIDEAAGNRLGVKGTNDLGNGMSVDYLLEYGAGDSLKLRHANMTLNGSFGQFRFGQQTGVLYRYIGANSDQSVGAAGGGKEWYTIASENMNSDHSLRMSNIAAYRFGAGPGGDDPITFDIQIQGVDRTAEISKITDLEIDDETYNVPALIAAETIEEVSENEAIDSVTFAAATALGPVKLQLAYVDENGDVSFKRGNVKTTWKRSPNLLSFGFRAPLGSAEIRGHMTEVDADMEGRDDDEAWGLLVMNDFGSGYFGMVGVGSYTNGGKEVLSSTDTGGDVNVVHKNDGDITNAYVSLTKSFGGGLSAIAEYSTVSKTVTKADNTQGAGDDRNATLDDDEENTNTFQLYLIQSF